MAAAPSTAIKFGTSGWRAIIAEEFTFANVRLVTAAIAAHVLSKNPKPMLIVGHDTRIFGEDFAATASAVLRDAGIRVLLCDAAAPTPAIAHEILRRKTDGAINFTASHNPAEYQGLKFSGSDGGPALPDVTRDIEARVKQIAAAGAAPVGHSSHHAPDGIERISPREPFLKRLAELVNLKAIRDAKLKLVVDPLHGAGVGYLDGILRQYEIPCTALRLDRDVLFDGHGPDVSESNMKLTADAVRREAAHCGLATDGDADRFGVLDADGSFVSPNHILALLYDYMVETRGWKLGTARSVATTHLMDAVARLHGQECFSTPVGFKYVGECIKKDTIALGGEESAGLSIRGHVPEKDGVLACLLVAEMIATRKRTIAEQLRALFARVGREFWPIRVNLHLPDDVKARLLERLKADPKEFLGRAVTKVDRTDGAKFIFANGDWTLMRLSGTEPLVRVYTEAGSPAASQQIADDAQRWIFA